MSLLGRLFGRSTSGPKCESSSGCETAQGDQNDKEQTAVEGGEAALATVYDVVCDIVERHISALVAKRRQKTYQDDYGRLVDDAWQSEIDYFRVHIVDDELINRCGITTIAAASLQVFVETPQELREASDDVGFPYELRINRLIDIHVQQWDAETSEEIVDVEQLSPSEYEKLCADLLASDGWDARVCGGTGDQGVDIVAERDGVRAVFQCKLYSKPVGNSAVQEVHSGKSFHSAELAVVVSPAGYTPSARAAAAQTGVLLLHHSQLEEFGEQSSDD